MRPRRPTAAALVLVLVALLGASCASGTRPDGDSGPAAPSPGTDPGSEPDGETGAEEGQLPDVLVLVTHGGALTAYDGRAANPPASSRRLHPTGDAGGASGEGDEARALSGQVCVVPDGSRRVVTASTGPAGSDAGWSLLDVRGEALDSLTATPTATFAPTSQPDPDDGGAGSGAGGAEAALRPQGCAFLPDGRLLTTDRGLATAPGTGQLVLWFPPYVDDDGGARACKVAVDLAEPGDIWVDDQDRALVAAASGIWRFSGPWPTGPSPEDGCDGTDATGAPTMARPRTELLVPAGSQGTSVPAAVAGGPGGDLFISSPDAGTVTEHDINGTYRQTLAKPTGDGGAAPTPVGLAVGPDRTVFVLDGTSGAVDRYALVPGVPPAPEVLVPSLDEPSGIGVALPSSDPGSASKV